MTPTDNTALLDNAVLLVLEANNTQFGLSAPALRVLVAHFGFKPTEDELIPRLEYLTDRGLSQEIGRILHRHQRNWKITPAGRRYCDEQNL